MHNILTMENDDLVNTVEYRSMYMSIVENTKFGIHINILAKDAEQIEEIKYMRPLDNVEYVHPYLIFNDIEDILYGLRDMFDMLDDERSVYMSHVIKKINVYIETDNDLRWIEKKMSFMATD